MGAAEIERFLIVHRLPTLLLFPETMDRNRSFAVPVRFLGWRLGFMDEEEGKRAAEKEEEYAFEGKDAALKALFQGVIELHLLQKLDAAADGGMLPRL